MKIIKSKFLKFIKLSSFVFISLTTYLIYNFNIINFNNINETSAMENNHLSTNKLNNFQLNNIDIYENCKISEIFGDIKNQPLITDEDVNKFINCADTNDKNMLIYLSNTKNESEIKELKNKFGTIPVNSFSGSFREDYDENGDVIEYYEIDHFKKRLDFLNSAKEEKVVDNGIAKDILQKGDQILSINGLSINDLNNFEKGELLNELERNQNLNVDSRRFDKNGSFKYIKYITKVNINDLIKKSGSFFIATNPSKKIKVVYIKFKSIDYDTVTLLKHQLEMIDFYSDYSTKLVFDLSDCDGGDFGAARRIACFFLKKGTKYLTLQHLNENDALPFALINHEVQRLKTDTNKLSLNVIVNEKTADAAEQLAAILKDCANAKIYGKRPKKSHIEYRGFDVYNSKNPKEIVGYVFFPKTAYKAGNYSDSDKINNIKPINVDYDDTSKNILSSIILGEPLDSEESKISTEKPKTSVPVMIKYPYKEALRNNLNETEELRKCFLKIEEKPDKLDRKNCFELEIKKFNSLSFFERLYLHILALCIGILKKDNYSIKLRNHQISICKYFSEEELGYIKKIFNDNININLENIFSIFKNICNKLKMNMILDKPLNFKFTDITSESTNTNFSLNKIKNEYEEIKQNFEFEINDNKKNTQEYIQGYVKETLLDSSIQNLRFYERLYFFTFAIITKIIIPMECDFENRQKLKEFFTDEEIEMLKKIFKNTDHYKSISIFRNICNKLNINRNYIDNNSSNSIFTIGAIIALIPLLFPS